jgi:hypothetical protein
MQGSSSETGGVLTGGELSPEQRSHGSLEAEVAPLGRAEPDIGVSYPAIITSTAGGIPTFLLEVGRAASRAIVRAGSPFDVRFLDDRDFTSWLKKVLLLRGKC